MNRSNDNKITLVSAFFNINREEWKKFRRNDELYFSYFEHWARIKNELIVFVESKKYKKRVFEIRDKFGNKEKTKVVIIEDILNIDQELYKTIEHVCSNRIHYDFRLQPDSPEVFNAKYNYIMALKMWCLKTTVENGLNSYSQLAWIDFGFGHGLEIYPKAEEFDFEWQYNFGDKIYLPAKMLDDGRPIFDVVRTMDVYVMGPLLVGNSKAWRKSWEMMKTAVYALAYCGMTDDDQTELLMLSRMYPETFELVTSVSWGTFLKEKGGDHLTLSQRNPLKEKISEMKIAKIRLKIKRFPKVMRYLLKQYKYMMG